jgi:hypothetical protein
MHYLQNVQTGISALLGIGLLITTGCGDVDQSGTDTTASDNIGTETDALRGQHWYRPPKTGTGGASAAGGTASTAGGAPTSGGTAGSSGSPSSSCGICATTQSCCESVGAGALCTFSADTCASLDPQRQASYANYCLTVLRTTISAHTLNQRSAPAACSMPK